MATTIIKNKLVKIAVWIVFCACVGYSDDACSQSASAYTAIDTIGPSAPFYTSRSAALFLLIPADSRSAGMGNAGVASNPDVTAVFCNNAKLPFANENIGFHATYTPWFVATGAEGMYLLAFGGYYKKKYQVASFSVKYFQYPKSYDLITGMDASSSTISFDQSFSPSKPYELSTDLGYSVRLSKGLSVAVTGRYVISSISARSVNASYSPASSFLADLSLFYEKNVNYRSYDVNYDDKQYFDFGYDKVYAAAVLSNVGGKFQYNKSDDFSKEMPPTQLRLGLGYRKIVNELSKLVLTAEVSKLLVPAIIDSATKMAVYNSAIYSNWAKSFSPTSLSASLSVNSGCEFWYNDLIAFRLGYSGGFKKNSLSGVTLGFSLRISVSSFDISYYVPASFSTSQNYHPLSNSIRMGLTFYLD